MAAAAQKIGKVCEKHPELLGLRLVANSNCTACAKERAAAYRAAHAAEMAEYLREYQRENAEKLKAYYAKHKKERRKLPEVRERERKAGRERYAKNSEVLRQVAAEYRAKTSRTPEQKRASVSQATAWNRENKGRRKEIAAAYQAKNASTVNANTAARRSRKLQATPAWANRFFMQETYRLAKMREALCGGKWHVDHIVPLRSKLVCGLHCEANMRVIPALENHVKNNKYWPDMP